MANVDKLLQRARNAPQSLSFEELNTLVQKCGFKHERTSGSHHIYIDRERKLLSLQPDRNGKAKAYQVRQFLKALDARNPVDETLKKDDEK